MRVCCTCECALSHGWTATHSRRPIHAAGRLLEAHATVPGCVRAAVPYRPACCVPYRPAAHTCAHTCAHTLCSLLITLASLPDYARPYQQSGRQGPRAPAPARRHLMAPGQVRGAAVHCG